MRTRFLVLLLLSGSFLMSCGVEKPAARVGGELITIAELQEASSRIGNLTQQALYSQLDNLIQNRVVLAHAYQADFDDSLAVVEKVQHETDILIYQHVLQTHIVQKVIPERELKKLYEQNKYEWRVSHIFLKAKEADADIAAELRELRMEILKGASFEAAARRISQDSLSAGRGGDLGFITWGDRSFGDEFYKAVADLQPGQVSPAVKSKDGYHLILLRHIRERDVPPYAEQKSQLRSQLIRENISNLNSKLSELLTRLKDYYHFELQDENADSLLQWVKTNPVGDLNRLADFQPVLDALTDEQQQTALATMAGEDFTVLAFFDRYQQIPPGRRPPLGNADGLATVLDRFTTQHIITRYGKELGYALLPKIIKEVQSIREDEMVRLYMQEERPRPQISNAEINDYYEQHADQFSRVRLNVQEIMVRDVETAEMVYQQAQDGANFSRLADAYNMRQRTKNKSGRLGWIQKGQFGNIGDTAATLNVGDVSSPVKAGNSFSIIKLLDRESRDTPFDEAKAQIEQTLARQRQAESDSTWMAELKSKMQVYVYSDRIEKEFRFDQK